MDIIIDWQKYEAEFNGQAVTMELRPLRRDAMMLALPMIEKTQTAEGGSELMMAATSLEMQALAGKILPDHVRAISGFTVNGAPPEPAVLCEEIVFCGLVGDICGRLVTISLLKEPDEKNSGGPSASTA